MSLQIYPATENITNFQLMSALYLSGIAKGFDLLPSVFAVLIALSNHYNRKTRVVISGIEVLSDRLNMSKPTIINAIKILVEKGLIIKSKSRSHSVYTFTPILFEYLKTESLKTRKITVPSKKQVKVLKAFISTDREINLKIFDK